VNQIFLLLPIGLPALFWAAYHYHKDRHLPEPVGHLAAAFLLGMFAAAISQGLYASLGWVCLRHDAGALAESNVAGLLAYALLAIGPIEEFAKLLPFAVVILRFREFDEPLDGLVYASFIGLGYAAVENWQYREFLTPLEAAARGFASPVVHIVFASVWAHRISAAHLAGKPVVPAAIAGFGLAAALHGVYDFIVLLEPRSVLPLAGLLVLALWIWRLRLMHTMQSVAARRSGVSSGRARTPM
jgi:RsiW-degrading membrane proteinase PrsW (M82 family)